MRSRKLRWVLAGLAVLVAAGAFALWPRASRITRGNYERIRQGMTHAEVEACLGSPGVKHPALDQPVPYEVDPYDWDAYTVAWRDAVEVGDEFDSLYWLGDAGILFVQFEEGRAVAKVWSPRASPLLRFQRWWKRWFS